MNRFYSKVVASVICAVAAVPSVSAVTYEAAGGITYEIDEAAGTAVFARLAIINNGFNITELDVPDEISYNNQSYKVVAVGERACYLNSYLQKITIGQNVTTIKASAFYNCINVGSISFPAGLDLIEMQAFYGCKSLQKLELPEGLSGIGSFAFYNNQALTEAYIPASVTRMGDNPFGGCTKITAYTVAAENPKYTTEGGVLFNKAKTELISYPVGNTAKSYTVPSSVKKIGSNSMRNNSYMQTVVFPESLEEIATGAFNVCCLTSVTIPASVTTIGNQVFTSNTYLTEFKVAEGNPNYTAIDKHLCTKDGKTLIAGIADVAITIPESVETIDGYAFYQSNRLRTLDLKNVKHIGRAAFYRCTQLNSVDFGSNVETIGRDAFMTCSSLAAVTLPATARSIGEQCFLQCGNMTQLKLNEGLDSIGSNAFMLCNGLVNLTVPGTLRKAGAGIFCNNVMLKSVTFNEGLEAIPYSIFDNCSQLSSVQLPSTLKTIGDLAFDYTSALTSIELPEGLETIGKAAFQFSGLREVRLPNSVKEIGTSAFGYCTSLVSFIAGSGLKTLGDYSLGVCSAMITLQLNEGLESIGQGALAYNSSLASVCIPSTVTSFGSGMFSGNSAMTIIENRATTPQMLTADILEKAERYEQVALKVPAASIAAYKSAPIWSKFTHVYDLTSGIAGVDADNASIVEIYDVNGVRHQQPVRGVNIYRMSDGSIRKVFVAD